MSGGVDFDESMRETIERLYRTDSMTRRRAWIRDLLAPERGESVLSIGTGPGYEAAGLAPAVGETGGVLGIDPAPPMLAAARERCAGSPQVSLARGDATALPVADGAVDAALAVQVYEYVPDLDAAFAELARVLAPGGRAVVFDSDWTTMTYNVVDEARSERILRAFDAHCPHPRIARTIDRRLTDAGLRVTDRGAFVHLETTMDEDAVGAAFVPGIAAVAVERGDVDEATVEAWEADLRERDRAGEFFFSFNQYGFLAEKPA